MFGSDVLSLRLRRALVWMAADGHWGGRVLGWGQGLLGRTGPHAVGCMVVADNPRSCTGNPTERQIRDVSGRHAGGRRRDRLSDSGHAASQQGFQGYRPEEAKLQTT